MSDPAPRPRDHTNCVHYQLSSGQAVQVDKTEWYDYCTDDLKWYEEFVTYRHG